MAAASPGETTGCEWGIVGDARWWPHEKNEKQKYGEKTGVVRAR
jgi:hypothetical protein